MEHTLAHGITEVMAGQLGRKSKSFWMEQSCSRGSLGEEGKAWKVSISFSFPFYSHFPPRHYPLKQSNEAFFLLSLQLLKHLSHSFACTLLRKKARL
jgi:hypothetical protein